MPQPFSVTTTVSFVGQSYTNSVSANATADVRQLPQVGPAVTGTLTTRTDAATGTLTLAAGHGVTTGEELDVYWRNTDGTTGQRHGMTAGTVSGNSVPVSGGAGTDLPAANATITAMVPVQLDFVVVGNDLIGLVASSPVVGYVAFVDNAGTPAEIATATFLVGPGTSAIWANSSGVANPLAGKTTSAVRFSHGDSTGSRQMTAAAGF